MKNTTTDTATGVHCPKFAEVSKFVTEIKNDQIRTTRLLNLKIIK